MKPLRNELIVSICIIILLSFSANLFSIDSLGDQNFDIELDEESKNDHRCTRTNENDHEMTQSESEGVDPGDWCLVDGGDTSYGEYITNVQFNGIDRDSENDGGYADHTDSISDPITHGETYEISITMNTGDYENYVTVVIDWSLDYDLSNEEIIEVGSGNGDPVTVTEYITVPADADSGQTLMRVMQNYGDYHYEPCQDQSFGETEDYTVDIGDPPSIEITRPIGGEEWESGDDEEITWETSQGAGAITGIDLEYSSDDGSNWIYIVEGLDDTGTYTWNIPEASTALARIRATVHADDDMEGTEITGSFTIIGDPPDPPDNLEVERSGLAGEAVDNGKFFDNYEPWEPTRVEDEGETRWDEESYEEGGSIYVHAEAEGEDDINAERSYWHQDIVPTSKEIEIVSAFRKNLERDDLAYLNHATVKLQVNDSVEGWETILIDDDSTEGDTSWVEFDTQIYEPVGVVDAVRLELHVEAQGGGSWGTTYSAMGEIWMDNISVVGTGEGDEHNLLTWDASPDDPDSVSRYNISRSEEEKGPFDRIGIVKADGSESYRYFDENRGSADDIWWYYQVHAVSGLDQKCDGTDIVGEPGEPFAPEDPQPPDGAEQTSIEPELSVYVEHQMDDPMDVSFYDASDDSLIGEETNVQSGTRASVIWDGLEFETEFDWYAVAEEGEQTNRSETWSFTTEKGQPTAPMHPEPEDGAEDISTDIELKVEVEHQTGESMDVSFYDASDDSLIGSEEDVGSGSAASTAWIGLELDSTYSWYVVADDGENSARSEEWSFSTEGYTLLIDTAGGGSTDPQGLLVCEPDKEVDIEATPEEGWYFDEWTGDHEGDEKNITVIMDSDKQVTAHFELHEYHLTVDVDGEGIVEIDPEKDVYEHGDRVDLTAVPDQGWYFTRWVGDHSGTLKETVITMDGDKQVTANFDVFEYELTMDVEGEGSIDPQEGTHTYEHGTEINVTAAPEDGWYFVEWTGDHEGTEEEITIEMDSDKEIIAHFEIRRYELTIDIEGEGSTDPQEGNHTYTHGEEVTIEAIPLEGWYFVEWTGDYEMEKDERVFTMLMKEDKNITAHFEEYEPAYFEVEIIGYDESVEEDENVTIKYRVKNTGERSGTQDVVLLIKDGGEEEELVIYEDLTLSGGELYEGEFTWNIGEEGEYAIEIASDDHTDDERSLTVEERAGLMSLNVLFDHWWIIIMIAVISIILAVLVWKRAGEEPEEEKSTALEKEGRWYPPSEKDDESKGGWMKTASGEAYAKEGTSQKVKKVKKGKKKKQKEGDGEEDKYKDRENKETEGKEKSVHEEEPLGETDEKRERRLDIDIEKEKGTEEKELDESEDGATKDEEEVDVDVDDDITCPLCGNEVDLDSERCFACGKDLTGEDERE